MATLTTGTLVVGAGVAGSALAMHLAEAGEEVLVVDPDLVGELSSSERNAGGVRATWWQPVNVELCSHTIDYLAAHADALGFRQSGYLWLYGEALWEGARGHAELQNRFGREVELLRAAQVGERWPVIDVLDGIAGATFSPRDGLVNSNAVKEHYRVRARAAGAAFADRRLLVGVGRSGRRVRHADLLCLSDAAAARDALVGGTSRGERERVACTRIVNAAGPWAAPVAELLGASVPCRAVRRQVCLVASRDVDLGELGMIVDTTGVYFHQEGPGTILAGYSPPGDPAGYSFRYDGRPFFETEIWPRLAGRITAMDRLEHVSGWAGLYELSPDNSAVLGRAEPLENAYEIHSFSGRGVMQSHAAGLALAELILQGRYVTFPDAAGLSRARFRTGAALPEELHI